MRFFNGIVVGVLLAIGAAYLHDRSVAPGPAGEHHELVNWDEFGRGVGAASAWAQARLDDINDRLHRR